MQDLDDGAYHEEDEQAEQFTLKVQDIVALEWATCHSLGLGSNDYTPACVMHVLTSTAGDTMHCTCLGLLLTTQITGRLNEIQGGCLVACMTSQVTFGLLERTESLCSICLWPHVVRRAVQRQALLAALPAVFLTFPALLHPRFLFPLLFRTCPY